MFPQENLFIDQPGAEGHTPFVMLNNNISGQYGYIGNHLYISSALISRTTRTLPGLTFHISAAEININA
jgi:hypothetical protein